jgi:hypothetical protein
MPTISIDHDHCRIVLIEVGLAPLLKLDDRVGRRTSCRVPASQNCIDPATAERQAVLQQNLDTR